MNRISRTTSAVGIRYFENISRQIRRPLSHTLLNLKTKMKCLRHCNKDLTNEIVESSSSPLSLIAGCCPPNSTLTGYRLVNGNTSKHIHQALCKNMYSVSSPTLHIRTSKLSGANITKRQYGEPRSHYSSKYSRGRRSIRSGPW